MSQPETATELLTVEEFAKQLKVSRTTVFSWLKTGEIQEGVHFIRIGRVLRFRLQIELLFREKSPRSTKRNKRKRPAAPGRQKSSTDSAINLDYGALPV